ncbi:MAG: MFS transporter [Chloroflexi bacterium]|nr:MFS transporter [Chloroflexota bacterium]
MDATAHAIADQRETVVETDENPFGPRRIGLTIGLLLTVSFVAFETLAVATVLPAVVADLGGLNLYGWTFSAFLLTQLVGIVISGLLADERGPIWPFALGIVLFSVGLLVGGFAPSMPALIAGRALQGLGGGAISSIAYVAIGRGYPEGAKPRMLALTSTAWVVPGLVGPGIAGVMAEAFGWRSVFLVLAPLPGLAALLAFPSLRRMPAGIPSPQARARVVYAVVLAAGSGLILTGIGIPTLAIALALTAAGLALAIPAMRRLLPAGTLRAAPGMPATIATMGLLNLAFFGVDAFVPLALVDVRGTSVAFAGLALTAATVTWTAGAWVQARTAARISRRLMVRFGLAFLATSFVITAAVLFPSTPLPVALVGWGVAGLGMGLAYTTLGLSMLELAEPGQEGDASASLQLASVLGAGLGAGVGGALIALIHNQGETLTRALLLQDGLMLVVIALGLAAAGGLPGRLRLPARDS